VPIYEYVCPEGHRFERVLKVADCSIPQACECGLDSQKVLSVPMVFVSQEIRYESPIDGKVITNKQQRQDDLARHGCIPYDPEMKKDAARRQVESEKKLEAAMDATIEKTIHEMPSRKREKLTAELQGGVTADYVRLGV
jgi:putative FmdB family regulatory protein